MNVSPELAAELQAIFSSPPALLSAINDRLQQIQILGSRWAELTGKTTMPTGCPLRFATASTMRS